MSDHSIDFTYEYDDVRAHLTCHAPADAACRSTPSCDCETYTGPYKDEQGWYHEALQWPVPEGEEEEVQHRHTQNKPGAECAYQVWVNADSPFECGPRGKFGLDSLPVDLTWEGDFYSWTPSTKVEPITYSLAEIKNGTGFAPGVRFQVVS